MTFGVILAIQCVRLDELFNRTYRHLMDSGFVAVSEVYRLGIGESGDITILDADETDESCLLHSIDDKAGLMTAFATWDGLLLVFARPDVTMEVGVTCSQQKSANIFLRIPERFVQSLFTLDDVERLYRLLSKLALEVGAECGIGDIELEPEALGARQIIDQIVQSQADRSVAFGLISCRLVSKSQVDQLANDRFTVRQVADGYWLLEEQEFRELYEERVE
jgi:hypothetical protein